MPQVDPADAGLVAGNAGSAPTATPAADPTLHQHALDAERALEQLATGLGQAGAEADIVKTFSQMAEVTRQLALSLGKGQEQTADDALPADEVTPAPPTQPRTIEGAARGLQRDMVAAAGR